LLGRGGVGAVYRARDHTTGEWVALKTLELANPHAQALFEREYQTLASIAHPSVIKTFDFGVAEDGRRYYTMELIEGHDLYALAPMTWQKLCRHLRDVAEALSLLHARGLAHRDVSPRNIRIDKHGQARLLDFGALVTFGVAKDLVGTPALTAPEAIQGAPIDGRSDLFSLGATAYIALCGDKPYEVRSFETALSAFGVPPSSLLERLPELPVALDDLILALLQIDPGRRPDSAADVIERLGSIGGFTERSDSEIPEGHFSSLALIGREREVQQLRSYLASAMQGRGTALVIEGASQIGKSRLAQELLVEARVLGAVTVRLEASKGTYGRASYLLVRGLLDAAPHEAQMCLAAEPQVAALIDNWSNGGAEERTASAALESSGAQQAAVVRWVEAVAERRMLVIVIEDAHGLEAASSGVVFGLAHGLVARRIMLALTICTDAAALTPTLERTVGICARIKLRGLSSEAIDALVTSIFSHVPHRTRLSHWVETLAGGNPGHSLELMAALVRRRIIRRISGSWSLPQELPQERLPASVEEALAAVLEDLSAQALELARLIAMHMGSVPLPMCGELMKSYSGRDVLALCDELLVNRVVSVGQAGYQISHEGYRKALLFPLDPRAQAGLHRSVGDALLVHAGCNVEMSELRTKVLSSQALNACLQAGWHFLYGGDAERGRELLRMMGIRLTLHGEGLADAVPALEGALAAYEHDGRSYYERIYLMTPLTLAGTYLDFRLTYRYGAPLVDTLAEGIGIDIARRLARVLPKRLALYAALAFAALRMPLSRRRMMARSFREALLGLIGLATAILGTYSSLTDAVAAKRVVERLRPLAWFPRKHPAAVAYHFQRALADLASGRYAAGLRLAREVLEVLQRPSYVRGIPEDARRQFVVGLHIVIGAVDLYRTDGRIAESIRALEHAGTPAALESVAGFRANYHASRGEMKIHQAARDVLDVLAAQGGSPWRQDVLVPRCLWWIEAQCEDALGLKRSVRQLETISRHCNALASTHAAAHACYLADRGLAAEALTRYGETLEPVVREPTVLAARLVAAYARVLRKAGQAERARELCTAALARFTAEERELSCLVHGVELELGLSLASLGDLAAAAEHLRQLCAAQQTHDNPLLHGLTHIACAEVALLQSDSEAFAEHIAEAERWATVMQYAAVFGLVQRLQARARVAHVESASFDIKLQSASMERACGEIGDAIAACRGAVERQQIALDILIEQSKAVSGYLYLVEQTELRLAAPLHGIEPPDALLVELDARVCQWQQLDLEATQAKAYEPLETVVDSAVQRDPIAGFEAKVGSAYRLLFLSLQQKQAVHLVAVAALVEGTNPIAVIAQPIIQTIANSIYDAGDATVMR